MSSQMPDNNRTVNLSNASAPGGPLPGRPGERNQLLVGAAVGCVVLLLLLACGGTAAWYFVAGPGKASSVPTAVAVATTFPTSVVANTPVLPTAKVATATVAATKAAATKPAPTEAATTETAATAGPTTTAP